MSSNVQKVKDNSKGFLFKELIYLSETEDKFSNQS